MKIWRILLIVALVAGLMGGCTLVPKLNNIEGNDVISPVPEAQKVLSVLYFGDSQAMFVQPEERWVTQTDEPLAKLLIQELIAGPTDSSLTTTIPKEVKLLSLEVAEGIAYANFSKELASKIAGSAGELMVLGSVVNTLTELPAISAVQFLVEGKVEESIWGHSTTSEPFERMVSLIATEQRTMKLYFASGEKLVAEQRHVERQGGLWAAAAVRELIAGPKDDGNRAVLPAETELLSLRVVDGLAYVDLSEEAAKQHSGGTLGESLTIYSIVNTLTELPEIDSVQFLLEGRVEEAIWGHADTTKPIERNEDIIKQ